MDDEDDFFIRKPLSNKPKSKRKAQPLAKVASSSSYTSNGAAQPGSSAPVASSSQSANTAQVVGDSDDEDAVVMATDVDEDDDDAVMSSSDFYASDDSDATAARRAKRAKKKHLKKTTLPRGLQDFDLRKSQEPSSSSSAATFFDARSEGRSTGATSMYGASERTNGKGKVDGAINGKQREASLTPPPDVSPERRAMAVNLVHQTFQIPSSFGGPPLPIANHTASATARVTRSTRNSATPAFGQDIASTSTTTFPPAASRSHGQVDVDADTQLDLAPELALLLPGPENKDKREKARRIIEERRKQRELERARQQAASSQAATSSSQRGSQFARVQSAPQVRLARSSAPKDGNDTDDSVELVENPIRKATTSPGRTRSSATGTQANDAVIVIDDSDDESAPPATRTNGTGANRHSPPPSPPPTEAPAETLSLTLQSKVGSMIVKVTPTTLLSRLVEHFHKEKKVNSKIKVASIRVAFDGDHFKQSQTVGDMGVEDEDQIELTWA